MMANDEELISDYAETLDNRGTALTVHYYLNKVDWAIGLARATADDDSLLKEWAHVRPRLREQDRTRAVALYRLRHNHQRRHTAIRALPINRVTNVTGECT